MHRKFWDISTETDAGSDRPPPTAAFKGSLRSSHLSEKTVESHRANVPRKLGMRDRVELVSYAIRRGLVEA